MDDLTDDELDLDSTHSSNSSKAEGDTLEGEDSLGNNGNSGETHNNHTNDAIQDKMTTMVSASSALSNLIPANSN